MSSLIDFILKPLWHLGLMLLSISISFIFKMPVNIIHYPGKVRIFNYRIFVKETNSKKLSLNLVCIITLVMTVLWSYVIIVCLLFLFVLVLLKHFVSKSAKYRGVSNFLFTLILSWVGIWLHTLMISLNGDL